MSRQILEEIVNVRYDIADSSGNITLSLAYCLFHRARVLNIYTIPAMVLKSFIRGSELMKKHILWALFHNRCVYCGMVGKSLLFHDIRVDVEGFFVCSVTPNCRGTSLLNYFDFNSQYIMDRQVAWISNHILLVMDIDNTACVEWSSRVGYVSIVTTFMRLVKANIGQCVTNNSIARAYINMLRGYLAVSRGDMYAENAFVRGLYLLEGVYFDLPDEREQLMRDHEAFAQWLTQPLPSALPTYMLTELLFKNEVFPTNADMDGVYVLIPMLPLFA